MNIILQMYYINVFLYKIVCKMCAYFSLWLLTELYNVYSLCLYIIQYHKYFRIYIIPTKNLLATHSLRNAAMIILYIISSTAFNNARY